jgi:predicted PP-loop superfamily ATPase
VCVEYWSSYATRVMRRLTDSHKEQRNNISSEFLARFEAERKTTFSLTSWWEMKYGCPIWNQETKIRLMDRHLVDSTRKKKLKTVSCLWKMQGFFSSDHHA